MIDGQFEITLLHPVGGWGGDCAIEMERAEDKSKKKIYKCNVFSSFFLVTRNTLKQSLFFAR